MFKPIKVVDIEFGQPIEDLENLEGYRAVRALVRLHGEPIGFSQIGVSNGRCAASDLSQAILDEHQTGIIDHLLRDGLISARLGELKSVEELVELPYPKFEGPFPTVTVAVCTRDRTEDLALCLVALRDLDYPNLEILIVDNAPTTDATEQLVHSSYPEVRYVREERPGLDWARNRAIVEARGEIIAYTDDDVIVDPGWVRAIARIFAENPEVMAVTGLVVPYELETEPQVLFEEYGGFSRGFQRRWYRVNRPGGKEWEYRGTGQFGTGANMAYRKTVFKQIGAFDPALDVGTVTNGGGDLEFFFRVLKEGYTLVYEPCAIVRHRHRRDYDRLRTQIRNNGIALYSFFVRSAWAYPEERWSFLLLGLWWLWWWLLRRLLVSFTKPDHFPRDLILAELHGMTQSWLRYPRARQEVKKIGRVYGSPFELELRKNRPQMARVEQHRFATAVRHVDISQPVQAFGDLSEYAYTRVFVASPAGHLGQFDLLNCHQPIRAAQLGDAIVQSCGLALLQPVDRRRTDLIQSDLARALRNRFPPAAAPRQAPEKLSVSVIVGTHDRPADLARCLGGLVIQHTSRQVELIVVDNNPNSRLTAAVVEKFPGVLLVSEPRKGVAYARNAGILAASGDLITTTDDDVTMPPDWLENLLAPFTREDVMAVTGNVLPKELETTSQLLFETYGGLGRGFVRKEANRKWFEKYKYRAVPTWEYGGTANAAFRKEVFFQADIGLMDEALGPGMPSGVGEDTYLFYKILKAGHTIVYEPRAHVTHSHRRTLKALYRQLYNYSKGHVAYHLTTLFRDHDLRALYWLLWFHPLGRFQQVIMRLRGKSGYPLLLILIEIVGNLAGPFSLLQSLVKVKRQGRSYPRRPRPEIHSGVPAKELVKVSTDR